MSKAAKQKEIKRRKWYDPVFKAYVHLIYGCTNEELLDYSEKYGSRLDLNGQGVEGLSFWIERDKVKHFFVYVRATDGFYTLSHEIIHMVASIFTDRGIPFCPENQETLAYYHTYWLRKMWASMRD